MELHQLRYLRAVVRSGSVTHAAELEHVAQPSISRQLRLLENELGVPLLHRVGRGVVPTDAAVAIADLADRVLDDIETTRAAIAPESSAAMTVRLCATETVADHLLPGALADVLRRYPNLSLSVEMLGTADSVAAVLADQADFAIVVLPLVDRRLVVEPLFEEDVLFLAPRGDPLAERDPLSIEEALRRPDLLLSMRGLGLRSQVEEAAAALGIELGARVELRSQRAIVAMVAAGSGVAFVPAISAAAAPAGVVARPLQPRLRREVGWIRRRGRHVGAPARMLLDKVAASSGKVVARAALPAPGNRGLTPPRTSPGSPRRPSGS